MSSDAEVCALYEASKRMPVEPPRCRLAPVFIAAPSGQVTSAKLDEVTARLKAKGATSEAGFAALAKADTDSKVEAARSGEIGGLAEPAIAPEIRAALKDLKPGGVTAPVRLANGCHTVRFMEMKPASTTPIPFDEVKDQLATQLRPQRMDKARQDFMTALVAKEGISLDEEALKILAVQIK